MWVDENRIINKLMPSIFQTGWPVVAELVQNSYRAQAKNVEIFGKEEEDGERFAIHDDGFGLKNIEGFRNLFVVGQSGFEGEEHIGGAEPAGMGVYSLLDSCDVMIITCGHTGLQAIVDSKKWFNQKDYRDTFFDRISSGHKSKLGGLSIEIEGARNMPMDRYLNDEASALGVYARSMNIEVNGHIIEEFYPNDYFEQHATVKGAEVWWHAKNKQSRHPFLSCSPSSRQIIVSWYGHRMNFYARWVPYPDYVYIEVSEGTPFHPKLPDREAVREDEKWQDMQDGIKQHIIDHICSMDVGYLCDEGSHYIDYLIDFSDKAYHDRSPVIRYSAIVSASSDYDGYPSYVTKSIYKPKEEVVYCIDTNEILSVLDEHKKPYEKELKFDLDSNCATMGNLIEMASLDIPLCEVPYNTSNALTPDEVYIQIKRSDFEFWNDKWEIAFAKDAVMVFVYKDKNIEISAKNSVWKSDGWSWPGYNEMMLIDDKLESVTHYSDDYLLEFNDCGDSMETQQENLCVELSDMCSDILGRVPLLSRKMTDYIITNTLGSPKEIYSIVFHDSGIRQATVTIKKPNENPPSHEKYAENFESKAIAPIYKTEDTWTGTFNIS